LWVPLLDVAVKQQPKNLRLEKETKCQQHIQYTVNGKLELAYEIWRYQMEAW